MKPALVVAAVIFAGCAHRRAAPNFDLPALDGRRIRLADLRGQVVLVNFWATWCAPCKIETPWLAELDRRYRARGLAVVGVAMDDPDADTVGRVERFAAEHHATYPIVVGSEVVAEA